MHTVHIRAAAATVVCASLLACMPAPSESPVPPAVPGPSSGPSEPSSPAASAGVAPACTAGDLTLDLGPWEGAAGSRFVVVTARASEDVGCTLTGSPGVALQDAAGEIILDSLGGPGGAPHVEPGDPVIVIGPERGATLAIGVSNWCDPLPRVPLGILLTLADDSTQGFIPAEGSPDDLPPCSAPGDPARIFVQAPWQPEA